MKVKTLCSEFKYQVIHIVKVCELLNNYLVSNVQRKMWHLTFTGIYLQPK